MKQMRFWMVFNPEGTSPKMQHFSRHLANLEAERLARLNPGKEFFVLKAMNGCVVPDSPVKKIELFTDEFGIPF